MNDPCKGKKPGHKLPSGKICKGLLDTIEEKAKSRMARKFKNKNLQVLCNDRLISTGFDAPKTDTIIIAKPTFSIVLYSQIIGRGLRGPEIGGTDYCKIIDVKDNIQGYSNFDAVYEYFDEYFENL